MRAPVMPVPVPEGGNGRGTESHSVASVVCGALHIATGVMGMAAGGAGPTHARYFLGGMVGLSTLPALGEDDYFVTVTPLRVCSSSLPSVKFRPFPLQPTARPFSAETDRSARRSQRSHFPYLCQLRYVRARSHVAK